MKTNWLQFPMQRSLIPILIAAFGIVAIPPLLHALLKPQLPSVALLVHDTPRQLPDFKFSDGSGKSLSLSRFRGTFILVNVWATWCPPCKEEMASLDHLASLVLDIELKILPISIDVSEFGGVRAFYLQLGLKKLPIYVDPSKKVMDALAITGIPTTLLIDREGREIARMVGPAQWDSPESVKRISKIFGR
jgi:thiol-disulfide isomerase/thioredoxin